MPLHQNDLHTIGIGIRRHTPHEVGWGMRIAIWLCLFLTTSQASADVLRTPTPIENCPTGSISSTPGTGLFHGAFSFCAPHVCANDAACREGRRCREVNLQITHRYYARSARHGAVPRPRLHVSVVAGFCEGAEPGVWVPPPGFGAAFEVPDIEPGCRRIQVCVPDGVGEPLGITARPAPLEPGPTPTPELVEPPEPEPAPSEPPPANPIAESPTGCRCCAAPQRRSSIAVFGLLPLAWIVLRRGAKIRDRH